MIKIKNYIFNENEIKRIEPYEQKVSLISERDIKGIKVVQKDINTIVDNVTVDDIEWNYGNRQTDLCKTCKVKNITKTNLKIKEIEEENKKLKAKVDLLKDNRHFLNNKISKAIEYIEKSINNPQPFYEYIIGDENGNVQNLDKLLKILKGE